MNGDSDHEERLLETFASVMRRLDPRVMAAGEQCEQSGTRRLRVKPVYWAAVLIIACIASAMVIQSLPNRTGYEGGAELAHYYRSLEKLFDDAELVVLGTFTSNTQVQNVEPGDPAAGKLQLREFIPETWIKGAVSTPIWVALHAREDPITGKWIGIAGEALYQAGSRYVLFLTEETHKRDSDYYWTTGAWQGSFGVRDGKVWSRAELGESEASEIEANGKALSGFLNTLSNTQ